MHDTGATWQMELSNNSNHFSGSQMSTKIKGGCVLPSLFCGVQPAPLAPRLPSFLDSRQLPDTLGDDRKMALFDADHGTPVCEFARSGCHNNVPQTWGLKTKATYSLAVLEGRSKWKTQELLRLRGGKVHRRYDGHSESRRNTGGQCQAFFH